MLSRRITSNCSIFSSGSANTAKAAAATAAGGLSSSTSSPFSLPHPYVKKTLPTIPTTTTTATTTTPPLVTPRRTLVVGNSARGVKKPSDSITKFADIIGDETRGGPSGTRLAAGELLGLMDLLAVRTGMAHTTGETDTMGGRGLSMATVVVDHTNFRVPVIHGDYLTVKGTPIYAGNSSLGIFMEVLREQFPTREQMRVCESFFTMVAIRDDLKTAKIVPALDLTHPEDLKLLDEYKQHIAINKGHTAKAHAAHSSSSSPSEKDALTEEEITKFAVDSKRDKVTIASTKVEAHRLFFPNHLNAHKTVFGGEILRWMEMHARRCAALFAHTRNVTTYSMHNITFESPVNLTDFVELEASVASVHTTTIEVDVVIKAQRRVVSNRASFIVGARDDVGQKRPLRQGLDLSVATPEERKRYALGNRAYELRRSIDKSRAPSKWHE